MVICCTHEAINIDCVGRTGEQEPHEIQCNLNRKYPAGKNICKSNNHILIDGQEGRQSRRPLSFEHTLISKCASGKQNEFTLPVVWTANCRLTTWC